MTSRDIVVGVAQEMEVTLVKAIAYVGRGWIRFVLVGCALVALALVVTSDGRRADAQGTTAFVISRSNTTISQTSAMTLVVDGAPQTVYVWAKDVKSDDGAAAFDVGFQYDGSLITITTLASQTTWLNSTGRSASCLPPYWDNIPPYTREVPNDPNGNWEGQVSCGTLGPPPPYGPMCPSKCNGLLATITIQPGSEVGNTTLNFSTGSQLVDTGHVSGGVVYDPEEIPATKPNYQVRVIHCGDFNLDGSVTIVDVAAVAVRFLKTPSDPGWDPIYDIDENGSISINDVSGTAVQFLQVC